MRRMIYAAAVVLCGSVANAQFAGIPNYGDTAADADARRSEALLERDAAIADVNDAATANPASQVGVMCLRIANIRLASVAQPFLAAEVHRMTGNYKAACLFYTFSKSEATTSRRFSASSLANP